MDEAPPTGPTRTRTAAVWQSVAAAVAVTLAHGMQAGWTDNQNTYFVAAVAQGQPALAKDLVARTADPTPVFTALLGPLARAGTTPLLVDLLWPAVAVVFFGALLWASGLQVRRSPRTLLLWTAGAALLVNPLTARVFDRVTDRLNVGLLTPLGTFEGVANQYALGWYVQPSTGAVLAVVGSVLVVRRRSWLLGTALVMVAPLLHPSYLVPALLLLGALGLAELWGARDRAVAARSLLPAAGVALAMTALWAVLDRDALSAVRGRQSARANEILAVERVPNHALPAQWVGLGTATVVVLVVVAVWLMLRSDREPDRRLGRYLACSASAVAVATVVVQLLGVPRLNLMFPWRASVVLVPLATSWLLGWLAVRLARWTTGRPAAAGVVAVVAAGAVVVSAAAGVQWSAESFRDRPGSDPLVRALRSERPPGVGIVPEDLEDVRLGAGVPVYADWKTHPVEPAAVVEWWSRIQRVERAMEDPDALCRLVARVRPGWVVVPADLAPRVRSACLAGWSEQRFGDLVLLRPAAG